MNHPSLAGSGKQVAYGGAGEQKRLGGGGTRPSRPRCPPHVVGAPARPARHRPPLCRLAQSATGFHPFNAHDSESHLALSHSLVHGLGYTRNMVAGAHIPHTTWPPGLPVLLMPALAVSGETINWWAVNGTILRIGLLGVVLVWLYARRLTESRVTADIAALLFAFHPFYWHFSRIAMTRCRSPSG